MWSVKRSRIVGEDQSPALSSLVPPPCVCVCVFGDYKLHMQAQERFWILAGGISKP